MQQPAEKPRFTIWSDSYVYKLVQPYIRIYMYAHPSARRGSSKHETVQGWTRGGVVSVIHVVRNSLLTTRHFGPSRVFFSCCKTDQYWVSIIQCCRPVSHVTKVMPLLIVQSPWWHELTQSQNQYRPYKRTQEHMVHVYDQYCGHACSMAG